MMTYISIPKTMWQAVKLAYTLVIKGYTAERQHHQIILTKRV